MRQLLMGRPAVIGAGILAIAALALWLRSGSGPAAPLSPAQSVAARFANASDDVTGSVMDAVAERARTSNAITHLTLSPTSLVDARLPDTLVSGEPPQEDLVYAPPALEDAATPTGAATSIAEAEPAPALPARASRHAKTRHANLKVARHP